MEQILPRGFLWGFAVSLQLLGVVLMLCLFESTKGASATGSWTPSGWSSGR